MINDSGIEPNRHQVLFLVFVKTPPARFSLSNGQHFSGQLNERVINWLLRLRNYHQRRSPGGALVKKVVSKKIAKLTEKELCRSLFLIQLQVVTLIILHYTCKQFHLCYYLTGVPKLTFHLCILNNSAF